MVGAVTAGLWLVHRRLAVLAAVAAVVMAFARVYIAAHYPQDVLAGLALGAVIGLLGFYLARPLLARLVALAARTPLHVLLTGTEPAGTQHESR
jgi:undecaprenyl-diphosphatase